jgi:hypothetical protein
VANDVTERLGSLRASVAALRREVPAIEWRTGQILGVVSELADLVAELAAAGSASLPAATLATKPAEDRKEQLGRLAWMACRVLPAGLEGVRRDAEICRILESWHVSREELRQLGYSVSERVVIPAPKRNRSGCVAVK